MRVPAANWSAPTVIPVRHSRRLAFVPLSWYRPDTGDLDSLAEEIYPTFDSHSFARLLVRSLVRYDETGPKRIDRGSPIITHMRGSRARRRGRRRRWGKSARDRKCWMCKGAVKFISVLPTTVGIWYWTARTSSDTALFLPSSRRRERFSASLTRGRLFFCPSAEHQNVWRIMYVRLDETCEYHRFPGEMDPPSNRISTLV